MKNGFVDLPIKHIKEEDALEVHKYVKGISNFIVECPTPMTIAIQGGWGSGKTSLMNLVEENIAGKNKPIINISVNTWQYSQFKMDDQLSISLIQNIIRKLNQKAVSKKETIVYKGKDLLKLLSSIAIYQVGGENASAIASNFSNPDISDFSSLVEKLKNDLDEYVDELIANQFERIVVYIDDLDRLEPKRAVELLEVLKNFFDCQHIVWVLAIDYDVIYRGVQAKYPGISDEKSKKFFDKLIQVPFQVPIQQYNIGGLVTKLLGKDYSKEDNLKLVSLITQSIGRNPREIKRLFNTFILNTKMMDDEKIDITQRIMLIAILTMQVAYEDVYNYLLSRRNDLVPIFDAAQGSGDDDLSQIAYPDDESNGESKDEERQKFDDYMKIFLTCINYPEKNINRNESNKNLEIFTEVLLLSSTTKRGVIVTENTGFRNQKVVNDYNLHDQYSTLTDTLKNIVERHHSNKKLIIEDTPTYTKMVIDNKIIGTISVFKKSFDLYFKLKPDDYLEMVQQSNNLKNMTNKGHIGLGNLQMKIDVTDDISNYKEQLTHFLKESF